MTPEAYHHPTRRELTSDLFDRMRRVTAATGTVSALLRNHDASTTALTDALQALERDLTLAAHEAEKARTRIMR
jgi:hypothetical protein